MCESLQGKLNNAVIYPELESLIVNPSNEKKEYKPSKYGFNNVIVNAIQSEELNIRSSRRSRSGNLKRNIKHTESKFYRIV